MIRFPVRYLSQCLRLQCLGVPQAAVPSGPRPRPQRVALRISLPLRVVDASSAAKGAEAPLFWALHSTFADGDLVRAAGTGGGPRRSVAPPGRTVGFGAAAPVRKCRAVGAQPHPAERLPFKPTSTATFKVQRACYRAQLCTASKPRTPLVAIALPPLPSVIYKAANTHLAKMSKNVKWHC